MKVKIVNVSPDFLGQLCRTTGDECLIVGVKGVPPEAKFLDAFYDHERNIFRCKFEHESFEDIEIGQRLPEMGVEHTVYRV